MRWATSRDDLLQALNRVARVVKSNPRSVSILQCVVVSSGSGGVYITAVSSMSSVKVLIPSATVSQPGEFAIDFDRFKDRVSKAMDKIVLDSDDDSLKIVSSEDQRLSLKLNDLREFPRTQWSIVDESYGLNAVEFANLLSKALSLSTGVSSLTPAFLQVKIRNQELWVASGSTYHRFALQCNPSLDSSIPVLAIPALISFIKEAGGDTIWMSQDSGDEIVISVGHDQLQTSPLAVQFPDLTHLFDKVRVTATDELHIQRRDLLSALSGASSSADSYGRVTLTFEGKVSTAVLVRTESEAGDWFETKVPCLWTGRSDRTLVFNVESLIRFVRSFDSQEIVLFAGEDFKRDMSAVYCVEGGHVGVLNQFRI